MYLHSQWIAFALPIAQILISSCDCARRHGNRERFRLRLTEWLTGASSDLLWPVESPHLGF
jgi:hypothetical protein